MFYAIFGDRLPISFTLSLTDWLTDSEVAIYFEMGVGFADLSIFIFVYVRKEYF